MRHREFNIETKGEAGAPAETAPREQFVQEVVSDIRAAGLVDQVSIQSFDWGALMRMGEVEPRFPQNGTVTDAGYTPYVTRAMVDDKPTMAALMDAGVDGLITDYPDRLRELMAERGLRLPRAYAAPRRTHGELLVAHDREDVDPGRTLESLYLDPLVARARREGGRIYRGYDGVFQLLIDVKSEAGPTYAAVHDALAEHRRVMTTFRNGAVRPDAVTAVISGNRDLAAMQAQRVRWAGYDGRMPDLGSGLPASDLPLLSDNWTKYFTWQGAGPMPEVERVKLHDIVDRAHAAGYRVRFWATPDTLGPARDAVWGELLAAGVDHLNTDDLAGLEAYLRAR